ncbi:MAG: hypothetical protein PVF83_13590 [Anaerolineales bacterium]|jgi:hypothetical protein
MSAAVDLINRVHALMARLYPYKFRLEFEGEMCTVFSDALADAAHQGAGSVFNLWWSELCDWPKRLLIEYWHSIVTLWKWRIIMTEIDQTKDWKIENRKDALIAALPSLLFGVGILIMALIVWKPWFEIPSWRLYLGAGIGIALPAVVVGVGGAIALIRRLPDWGYTWAGTAAMGTLLLVKTLAEEQADFGKYIVSEVFDLVLAGVLVLGCLVLLIWVALRGWQQAGLVSIGFASLMGVTAVSTATAAPFNRFDLALIAGPFGLLLAWLTYHFALGSTKVRGFVLAGIAVLNLGAVLLADSATRTLASQRPSFALPLFLFITAALLSGPILGLIGVPVRKAIKG